MRTCLRIARFVFVLVTLILLLRSPGVLAQATPRFEPADCMYEPLIPWADYGTVDCGYVIVPEQRDTATSKTIRLATVVLRSSSETPAPDPLIVAQGGPGGSTIETYVDLLNEHPVRSQRDIVLFDQRGTLYSQPNLICTEAMDARPALFDATDEEYLALMTEVTKACRVRLTGQGVNLAVFNSLENAADVDDVRKALGYGAMNFYGVSYGTLLGLHLMRNHPEHLRSVILDGVVPPQTNFITEVVANEQRVFGELFALCAAEAGCADQYPALESRFFAVVDRLNGAPQEITLTDPASGRRYRAPFHGDDLIDFLFQMFYINGSPGVLPKVILDAEAGNLRYIETMYSVFIFDESFSDGMYNSVICAEDADFVPEEVVLDGIDPHFAEGAKEDLIEYQDTCAIWRVPTLDASVDDPVVSAIPTLLLSGQFDPITPPVFAAAAAATLSNSHNLVLPTGGHGVAWGTDSCIDSITGSFLENPVAAPDRSCLPSTASFAYAPPTVISVPVLARLNSASPAAMRHLGWAALLLAAMASSFLVWPLGWLWRKLFPLGGHVDDGHGRSRHMERWLVILFLLLALLFVVGLTAVFFSVVIADPNLALLAAVPASAGWLLWLPAVLALLAVGILLAAFGLWWRRRGSVAARLYYTFLALCAGGYVTILMLDGFWNLV